MGGQVVTVLRKPRYLLTAIVVAVSVFTLAVWLPNFSLLGQVLHPDSAGSVSEKASFLWSLYGSIGTNFTVVSATYTIIIAVLFGVNISLLAYYISRMRGGVRGVGSTSAAGIGGLVSGIFGIGCAACGTFILTSVLALFGATGFLAILPLGGEEFGLIGVGLLVYSIYLLAKKINDPLVCEIN
tara:strand:+ start:2732 stop:3283 length:552 start_codon:yes stop_codon:yes gene_type:complete